jgi:hypothetical protein
MVTSFCGKELSEMPAFKIYVLLLWLFLVPPITGGAPRLLNAALAG